MEFHSPCAACKVLRRRCVEKCILSPYFPPNDLLKFAIAHKVFGASNITKLLLKPIVSDSWWENWQLRDSPRVCMGAKAFHMIKRNPNTPEADFLSSHRIIYEDAIEIPEHQREDAVDSLVYEANARIKDPIYGCAGAIYALQNQISKLREELAKAQAEILLLKMQSPNSDLNSYIATEMSQQQYINPQQQPCESSSFSVEDGNVYMPIGNANYYFGLEQVVDESYTFKSLSETQMN